MNKKCLLCSGALIPDNIIFKLHNLPSSAQNIPDGNQVKEDNGIDLDLYQCNNCGLVQFDCEPVDYYKKVIRAGGETSTMINLRRKQYEKFINQFNLTGKKIIEIGCGKGEFLKVWKDFDVNASGIEFNSELVEIAINNGLNVKQFFVDDENSVIPDGPFDAFCQFNFLEHQPHPNEMIKGIYNNLKDNGVGLVTVPSLEYILQYNGYYELIRDHIAYYSKETLSLLFQKNGFEVLSISTVNRDTHEIIVRKRSKIDVSNWNKIFNCLKQEFDNYCEEFKNKKIAVWGASHQGFTLIPTMELSNKVEYIIDSAVFKQGKFAPSSHVKIVEPDYFYKNPVDSILIVAPGYTDEIASIIKEKFGKNIDIRTLRSNHLEKL